MKIEIDWIHLTEQEDIQNHNIRHYGWHGNSLETYVLYINGVYVGEIVHMHGEYFYPVRRFDSGLASPIEKSRTSKRNKDLDKTKAKLMASIQAEAKWLIKTLTKH